MFAVPGWSISTSALQRQTQESSKSSSSKSTKKRKRGHGDADGSQLIAEEHPQSRGKRIEKKEPSQKGASYREKESSRGPREEKLRPEQRKPNHAKGNGKARSVAKPVEENGDRVNQPGNSQNQIERPGELVPALQELPNSGAGQAKLTPLQSSMRDKLISSRFRYLNQTLYTTPSQDSLKLFAENPAFFDEYHQGFRRQVAAWPENPVDGFIGWIKERGATRSSRSPKERHGRPVRGPENGGVTNHAGEDGATHVFAVEPLPRDFRSGTCTIADIGCGEAHLARALTSTPPSLPPGQKLKLRIHSFDLAAVSPLVTVADASRRLPLADGSVDVAIFCLALMGTDWVGCVEEAWRVLRWKGECWVAEVSSRFVAPRADPEAGKAKGKGGKKKGERGVDQDEPGTVEEVTSVPKAGPDVSLFVAVLRRRGFVPQGEPDASNKMFVRMRFVKAANPAAAKEGRGPAREGKKWAQRASNDVDAEEESRVLKPCVYKTR